MPSPTPAAPSCGRATAARCSTSASTTTIARCSSTGTASAPPPTRTCWSTRKRTSASTSASARRSRARFIIIDAHDHQTNEAYLIDADRPESALQLVAAREHGHEYSVDHHGDRLFIMTNSAGAEDFRICEAPVADPHMANWREVLPHKPGRLILDIVAFAGHLVRLEREDSLPRIVIRRLADGSRARHRLRRGGLFARHVGRLRVRHHHAALHLFVDDHAGPGVRLRHGDAHARAAQDAGGAERAQSGRLRHAPRAGAGAGRPDRARVRALPEGHAARRLGAAVPLRLWRLRHHHPGRRSRPRGSPWSTAASSSPSPTSAAARTRAIAGTPTASSRRRSTPSPTSSPPASIW